LGGLPGLFSLSGVLRVVALLPLLFVIEQRSRPLIRLGQEAKQAFNVFRLKLTPTLKP
jgi:hypothetical protein